MSDNPIDLLGMINNEETKEEVIKKPGRPKKKINESGINDNIRNAPLIDNTFNFNETKTYLPFNISEFINELMVENEERNKYKDTDVPSISGYSIASDCIMMTIHRFRRTPIPSFVTPWLPIMMRSIIGTSIHDFIQKSKQFTELERSLKVPSIRFSGRVDALIGKNILVEIKSCGYKDYKDIIKNKQPRQNDFYQVLTYKYIIENYLDELKNPGVDLRTSPPQLDKYDINMIQFIYIAHDLSAADIEDPSLAMKYAATLRNKLSSKQNPFCFITTVDIDLTNIDVTVYIDYIKEKIYAINNYLNTDTTPTKNDKFVDLNKCYFCLYRNVCELAPEKEQQW